MDDFLTFRRMITPIIIQAIYWILTVVVVGLGFYSLVTGDSAYERISGLILIVLGALLVRVYAELLILAFRISETLTEIKNNTAAPPVQSATSHGPAQPSARPDTGYCANCGNNLLSSARFCPSCGSAT